MGWGRTGGGQSRAELSGGHMEVISPHVASLQPADASLGRCLFARLQISKARGPVSPTDWCRVEVRLGETPHHLKDLGTHFGSRSKRDKKTCSVHTGAHSGLKGVAVPPGSW